MLNEVKKFVSEKFITIVSSVGRLAFLGTISILYGSMYFSSDLPDYDTLQSYKPPVITKVYSQDIELITKYAYEPRIFVKISDIPQFIISAFVAAEDKTFFDNYGIDPIGIVRAAIQNIFNIATGKRVVGASTITQQVVRGLIIENKRTIDRKISEAILAYRISIGLSKQQILELYLNQIFLGNNSYGIAMAAQTYFNKNLNELNIAEAATLAALPKAPSSINPYVNPERATERRNWVIRRMGEEKMIGEDEVAEYSKFPMNSKQIVKKQSDSSEIFYTEEVKKQLIELYGEKIVYTKGLIVNTNIDLNIQKFAKNALQNGLESYDKRHEWRGIIRKINNIEKWEEELKNIKQKNSMIGERFVLATILDIKKDGFILGVDKNSFDEYIIRNKIEKTITLKDDTVHFLPIKNTETFIKKKSQSLKKGDIVVVKIEQKKNKENKIIYQLGQIPEVNGAIVVIQNYTGKILGMVGGYDGKSGYFNRATQAKRQPGSAFKTIIYLTGLQNGFSADSLLMDEPIAVSQGKGMPLWRPLNLTKEFNGLVTLKASFVRSLNIPSIKIGMAVGLDKIYKTASELGVYPKQSDPDISCAKDEISKQYCTNYSLLLGAFETTLLDMTNAYAIIASDGYDMKPSLIGAIYDGENGNLLYSDHNITADYEDNIPVIRSFKKRIIKKDEVTKIVDLLESAVVQQSRILKRTVGGKSGTSNDSMDTWFIGMSDEFTVGIFVGYDIPKSLGKREIGATVARPIFVDFMQNALKNTKDLPIGSISSAYETEIMNPEFDMQFDDVKEETDNLSDVKLFLKPPKIEFKRDLDDDSYSPGE